MRDFIPVQRDALRRAPVPGAKSAVSRSWVRHAKLLPIMGMLVVGTLAASALPVAAGPMPDAYIFIDRGKTYNDRAEWDSAIKELDRAVKLDPSYNAFLNRGNSYRGKGDLDHAIQDYNEAIKLNPLGALAYLHRGKVYNDKAEYERAIQDFDSAIRLDITDANAFQTCP